MMLNSSDREDQNLSRYDRSMRSVGFWIAVGAGVALVGLAISNGLFSWFGRLPGDIRIETDNTRVFIPITSMLIVSVAASLLLSLLRRLF
jgi:uncharacterized protein HemY